MVNIYTTNCHKCKSLENRLKKAGIKYQKIDDKSEVYKALDKAKTDFVPILSVDGKYLNYNESIKWIGDKE